MQDPATKDVSLSINYAPYKYPGGGGGDSAYERGGDAHRKFWIEPLKEDWSGWGPSFFWPLKETMLKHRQYVYFYIFLRATLNETFTAKYDGVLPRTP